MFENLFSPSPLVWGGLIAGLASLPVLIHLINMLRHRRVKWAAMDFLLQSHKRQRNWIWLRQLLLLLSRIALLLLALFTLANIGCENRYASRLLGGRITHHYVLLDDSFSMSDQVAGESVFDHARRTVQTIAVGAGAKQNQRMTVLRFSRAAAHSFDVSADAQGMTAAQVSELEASLGTIADVNGVQIDSAFLTTLEERRGQIEVSQLASTPAAAMSLVRQLTSQRNTEDAEIHILSDFRAKDWQQSGELARQIEGFAGNTRIHFVRCAEKQRGNAAIMSLAPVRSVRSAGVPLFCDISIRNFDDHPLNNVSVEISSLLYDDSDSLTGNMIARDLTTPLIDETPLPPLFFESIPAGETVTQRFPVYFVKPGSHVIRAKLPEDAVSVDNSREMVIRIEESSRVLLIDDSSQRHAYYIASAFEPGGNRKTGVAAQIVTPDFLRTADAVALQQFSAIYLLDVERLDEDARRKISAYVAGGGGLAVFAGPKTDVAHYNERLYRRGQGFYPLPLQRTYTLPENTASGTADILPEDHPIFAPLIQTGGSLLDFVQLESVLRPAPEWSANNQSDVHVAAWVRRKGGYPLVVEKAFGKGRVVAVLTTAAPVWHNWNKNPTFVVALLEIQDFISAGRGESGEVQVGDPIRVSLDAKAFRSPAVVTFPIDESGAREQAEVEASQENDQLVFQFGSSSSPAAIASRAGIYELFARRAADGEQPALFRYAANVDPLEGDLKLASDSALSREFSLAAPIITNWSELDADPQQGSATQLTRILLAILLVLLLCEQILAYALSFHPKRGELQNSADSQRRAVA